MSPEAQRIAIAEACGTHKVRREMRSWNPHAGMEKENIYVLTDANGRESFQWVETVHGSTTDNEFIYPLDYPNDLNAMHEAEKVLTKDQKIRHYSMLAAMFAGHVSELSEDDLSADCRWSHHALVTLGEATATQRAEAFLRTIGKWEEGK